MKAPGAVGTLLETIETQRLGCELAGSPLYAEILGTIARDVSEAGACARLLAPYASAPFGDAVMLRLLAGVHRLVLDGSLPELATHYPSAGGRPGPDVTTRFLEADKANEDRLAPLMAEGVQTNEVGRSAALLCGFLELGGMGLPLRLLEVGASAGLNLWFDRFRYEAGAESFGPTDSPLRFVDPFFGRAPDMGLHVEVASRQGCDLEPIDPTTPAGRLRLRSYLWPDQTARRDRLDAALSIVSTEQPLVESGDAVTWTASQLAEPVPGVMTVIVHSIMFQYLPPSSRSRFLDEISAAGLRATDRAPVAWLRMEPGGDQAELRLTTWPSGRTRLLARSSFHGPPVVLVDQTAEQR